MVGPKPTSAFSTVKLETATIGPGRRFGRLYFGRYPDPLGLGKTPSRFSDPRRRKSSNLFGVLYLGESLKVCFLESILRDNRNGAVGDYPLDESELLARQCAEIEVARPLVLVDLRSDGCVRMGVPSDVPRSSGQQLARSWSLAFHDHPKAPDGIIYSSRLNEQNNVAVYNRAISKLRTRATYALINAPDLPNVLDELKVAIAG